MGIKYTPGPWYIRRMKDGRTIVEIGPICADEYAGASWLDVREEDARLIAAAPELLEALECLLAKADVEFKNIWPETRNDARAAIAKAKGEEQ